VGHALAAADALEWGLAVGMDEDDLLRAGFHAGHAGDALLRVNVVHALLVNRDRVDRADFGAGAALGAGAHLEHTGVGETGIDGKACLLGVVLLEVPQRTCHQARPTATTLAAVCSQMHLVLSFEG